MFLLVMIVVAMMIFEIVIAMVVIAMMMVFVIVMEMVVVVTMMVKMNFLIDVDLKLLIHYQFHHHG